jgi:regulator of protease activity HflC (stomatin/prohibitin superfamily)
MNKAVAIITAWIVVIVAVTVLVSSIVIIDAGYRGVHKEWGRVTGVVFEEGLHFIIPIVNTVDIMDIKTQKMQTDSSSASKDLQDVVSTIALNYRIKSESVAWLRNNIGLDYKFKVIDPAIQESIKASTAQFTAEELISKRPLVRDEMKRNLQEKMDKISNYAIVVEEFNIVNFQFSEQFTTAIEQKVTAEQLALKAQRDLERVKIEAQQKIEQAKAEAESIRIQSKALKENPDILQLRWIEKWNGQLPTYLGGTEGIILSIPS